MTDESDEGICKRRLMLHDRPELVIEPGRNPLLNVRCERAADHVGPCATLRTIPDHDGKPSVRVQYRWESVEQHEQRGEPYVPNPELSDIDTIDFGYK